VTVEAEGKAFPMHEVSHMKLYVFIWFDFS